MIFDVLEATGRLQDLGVLCWIVYSVIQELRWRPDDETGGWIAPAAMAVIGVFSLAKTLSAFRLADVALLALAIAIAAASGAVAGRISRIRPLSTESRARLEQRRTRGRRPRALPSTEVRTGWAGASLWLVTLAARYGVELVAGRIDSPLAESVGLGLLLVAATEASRVAVLAHRGRAHRAEAASPSGSQ
jgi:hypothetical protein